MKGEELTGKLSELRAELAKLKSAAARGTLKKQTGEIRALRRNIARILTVMNEKAQAAPKGKEGERKG